jgi:hypothetical protein
LPVKETIMPRPHLGAGGGACRLREHQATARPPATAAAPECVVIQAAGEGEGLASERGWLDDHYPGWKELRQALGTGSGDKWYDIVEFALPSGKQSSVCFDITSFFGKR